MVNEKCVVFCCSTASQEDENATFVIRRQGPRIPGQAAAGAAATSEAIARRLPVMVGAGCCTSCVLGAGYLFRLACAAQSGPCKRVRGGV